jgi:hypothetical protein
MKTNKQNKENPKPWAYYCSGRYVLLQIQIEYELTIS